MEKRNNNQDRDEGVRGHLLQQMDNEKALDELAKLTKPEIDTSENPAADSQWSTGRGCPKCKNTLRIKELNQDSGLMTVYCSACKKEYHAPDLESTTAIGDSIHRQIPDSLVSSYMRAREDELRRRNR